MRIHVLGIVGGILGFASLGLPWIALTVDGETASGTAFAVFDLVTLVGPAFQASPGLGIAILLLVSSVVLAMIGGVGAFLHPGGGITLFVAGVLGTLGGLWVRHAFSILPGYAANLGIGVLFCLAAGAVALGGYGVRPLLLWPRTPPASVASTASAPSVEAPLPFRAPLANPTPPPARALDVPPEPAGFVAASEPGWVVKLEKEIRGIEQAIGGEREALSRVEIAAANGDIDDPTYDALSRDYASRIALLERHLARRRVERDGGDPPPPTD